MAKGKRTVYFTIIKADGKTIDSLWKTNYANAKTDSLKVGAYWYAYANSTEEAIIEADEMIELLQR